MINTSQNQSESSLPAQRREHIVSLCNEWRFARVADLAEALGSSIPTIQRDLAELDDRGRIRRVRGGAMATAASAMPVPVDQRTTHNVDAKRMIGQAAAEQLASPGLIFLGSGTTVLAVAEHLDPVRHQKSLFVTNAYPVARHLAARNLGHLLLPGRLITSVEATVGDYAIDMLQSYTFDVAIIGFQGISAEKGLTDADAFEALLKSRAIAQSRTVIGVADASKWETAAPARICSLTGLSKFVTDKLPARFRKTVSQIDVVRARQ